MLVTAPIPGDMQVRAKAGSVYIQDSRCWHATPARNTSGRTRVAEANAHIRVLRDLIEAQTVATI